MACISVKPSNPSLAASRTTDAPLAPDRWAKSATVPKATALGSATTDSATRRSARLSRSDAARTLATNSSSTAER